jgi:hypothetical protein
MVTYGTMIAVVAVISEMETSPSIHLLPDISRKPQRGNTTVQFPIGTQVKYPNIVKAHAVAYAVKECMVEHRAPNGIRNFGLVSYPSMPVPDPRSRDA